MMRPASCWSSAAVNPPGSRPCSPMAAYPEYQGLAEIAISAPSAPDARDMINRHTATKTHQKKQSEQQVSDHQNKIALNRKLRCWMACQDSLRSARSNREGMCHAHSAQICRPVATMGSLRSCHTRLTEPEMQTLTSHLRNPSGQPQRKTASGRDRAMSGAASNISNSCSVMWALKESSPSSCFGLTSDAMSVAQPRKYRSTCRPNVPQIDPIRDHRRTAPMPYHRPQL